jgi:hypothetical protein
MRFGIRFFFAKEVAGLLALTLAFWGCRYLASSWNPDRIAFAGASEFKDFVASRGIHINSGAASGNSRDKFFVADRPLALDDFENLQSRQNCGLTPSWRGILWVCEIHNAGNTLCTNQMDGKWRVWGNVIVAGDEDLMERIEELYRKSLTASGPI